MYINNLFGHLKISQKTEKPKTKQICVKYNFICQTIMRGAYYNIYPIFKL